MLFDNTSEHQNSKGKENVAFCAVIACEVKSTNETERYELKCTDLTTNIGCAFNKDLCTFESPLAGDYVFTLVRGFSFVLDWEVCVSTVINENVSFFPLPAILKLTKGDIVSVHAGDNYLRKIDTKSPFPMLFQFRGFLYLEPTKRRKLNNTEMNE